MPPDKSNVSKKMRDKGPKLIVHVYSNRTFKFAYNITAIVTYVSLLMLILLQKDLPDQELATIWQ